MKKLRIGEILIAEGKIDAAQLKAGLAHQQRWGKKIGDSLVDLGFLSEVELVQALSRFLRLPLIDITRIDSSKITHDILNLIPVKISRKHRIVPLALKDVRRKERLVVATSDPTNYRVFDDLQFRVGKPLLIMLAPDSDIDWFIRRHYLDEGEALPYHYVSGVSIIQSKDSADDENLQILEPEDEESFEKLRTDPISTIFFDEDFTGVSKLYRQKKKDEKK